MAQTPYQPGVSYIPKYGNRYMNTNNFAPAVGGSVSQAPINYSQPTQQNVPPTTAAPPAPAQTAITMANPFVNNTAFQQASANFAAQPIVGFRQLVNYTPGVNTQIPNINIGGSTPTGSTTTSSGASFVSDGNDDNTGPGATSYDGGNTFFSNSNDFTDDDYYSIDNPNIPSQTAEERADEEAAESEGGSWQDWGNDNSDSGTDWSSDSGWSSDSNSGWGTSTGGEFDTSTPSTDSSTYNDKDGTTYSGGGSDSSSDDDSGGCFITTAIVERKGEADDGETLTKLRSFRDTFMDGKESDELKEYYTVAPLIVEAIPNDHSDWDWIEDQINLAIVKIDNDQQKDAYNIYKAMVLKLKEEWL